MALFPVNLEDERRKRSTHLEGTRPRRPDDGTQNPWARLDQLARRIQEDDGRTGARGIDGGGGASGAADGGAGGEGSMGWPGLDTPMAPDAGHGSGMEAEPAEGGERGGARDPLKIWSTWKMFEDEELKRERDVQELLQRLREEAIRDHAKVADWLRGHPGIATMLVQAIPNPAAGQGWNMDSQSNGGGPMSDGAGGFFV